jgi:hypothetical protein
MRTVIATEIHLSEVDVCTIRSALRRQADRTPLGTQRACGDSERSYLYRLADRLDPLVAATITQRQGA